MKKYFILLGLALFGAELQAQSLFKFQSLTGGTPVSVFTNRVALRSITLTASTANNTTLKLYDLSDTNYTVISPAYTDSLSYTTNITSVVTNALTGFIQTNIFSGTFTTTQSVSAATNEFTRMLEFIVPASSQRTIQWDSQAVRGITALSDYNAILELEYR